jgi:integrase
VTRENRRQYGTGSIYQRRDGRWVGSVEAGWTKKGNRRRVSVTGRSEAEVKSRLRARQRDIADHGVPEVSTRTTVKDYAERWLATTVTRLRPNSWNADRSAVTNWIIPTIGHKRLDALTPDDRRAVTNAVRSAGLKSMRRYDATLVAMLKAATVDGHRVPDRIFVDRAPATAINDRTAMSIPEAMAMLLAASDLPHGSRWLFAFLQGARQGECLGLTWDAVNLDLGQAILDWQLQPLPYAVAGDTSSGFRVPDGYEARHLVNRFNLVRPKSKAGFRVVPLVPGMVEALRQWREVWPENEHGLIYPEVTSRGLIRPKDSKADAAEWLQLQRLAGVAHPKGRFYTVHEARHTTATALLDGGVDPKTVESILGHSSVLTSRGYQHVSQRLAREALGGVAGRLEIGDGS